MTLTQIEPKKIYLWVREEITGYRYIRRTVTGIKDGTSYLTTIQMSEFEICDSNGTKMARPSGKTITSNGAKQYYDSEKVESLIDGTVNTKFCTVQTTLPLIITIDLGAGNVIPSGYDRYRWYTANDIEGRDPVSWTLELSGDGTNWTTVSTVSNASITASRKTLAGTWTMSL